ncbi:MAG: GNAT family N-acetyltransferase [Proteobacteria bacterium]|nr:GNAT family N-acetyltransferase [Pseudomonadota bacterium]
MSSTEWESYPDHLEPLEPRIGPFATRPFLETVWNHRDDGDAVLEIHTVPDGAVALASTGGHLAFAGQENLTDYHNPLGPAGVEAVVTALTSHDDASFRLDSLPETSAKAIKTGLDEAGFISTYEQHEVAAVLSLPTSYDEWLASIGKKERHEVRRKRRRFEAEFGEIEIVPQGPEAIDMFCAMHRTSQGDKGMFMTGGMQSYFAGLLDTGGASIHTLVCDGIPRANAFGFETEDGYYYYNSAYDVDAAMASPGIVLLASLIEAQIDRGATVFDFLKGDERYKFKHGATPRPLFAIEGHIS